MTTMELKKYETTLRSQRAELLDSLRQRDEIQIERQADALDDLTQSSARDFAVGEIERKNYKIAQIDAALQRIADGSYGICEDCEEEIPVKRLNAVPWANMCVRCQERSDSEHQTHRSQPMFEGLPIERAA